MRLWRLELVDEEGLLMGLSVVLAPDAATAGDATLSTLAEEDGSIQAHVSASRMLDWESCVLDLHMPDPSETAPGAHREPPFVWKAPYDDGLFQRTASAALVIAPDATAARSLVIDADPFEGQPPYGVPAVFGEAEPFVPASPYVLWIEFRERDDGERN